MANIVDVFNDPRVALTIPKYVDVDFQGVDDLGGIFVANYQVRVELQDLEFWLRSRIRDKQSNLGNQILDGIIEATTIDFGDHADVGDQVYVEVLETEQTFGPLEVTEVTDDSISGVIVGGDPDHRFVFNKDQVIISYDPDVEDEG